MGATVTGSGLRDRGRGRGTRRYRPLAEINVTPFVDVMLVLLIVFMVTAPLLVPGVAVDLPKATAKALPQDSKPLEISVDHEGAIFLADTQIAFGELVPRLLRTRCRLRPGQSIHACRAHRRRPTLHRQRDQNLDHIGAHCRLDLLSDTNQQHRQKAVRSASRRRLPAP